MLTDEQETIKWLKWQLKYQYPKGATTFGYCSSPHPCGRTARGGRWCNICIEGELSLMVGEKEAKRVHEEIKELSK